MYFIFDSIKKKKKQLYNEFKIVKLVGSNLWNHLDPNLHSIS